MKDREQNSPTFSPIFIVGCPRSGTTLVRSILAAHSRIIIAPESHFLNYWVKQYAHLKLDQTHDFDTFWADFSRSQRFGYFDLDGPALKAAIQAEAQQRQAAISFKLIFHGLLDAYAQKMQKPRWGEKTPAHYESLDLLLDWFPDARIIWIIRDPRATVASLMKVDWASRYAHANAYYWRSAAQQYPQWEKDKRVYLLRYEDLVQEPESSVAALCDFIGEAPEAAMIQNRSAKNVPNPHSGGWAKRHLEQTLKPIEAGMAEKWRSQLSPNQIAAIEEITRPEMERYGYGVLGRSLTPQQRQYLHWVQRAERWQNRLNTLWNKTRRVSQEARWVGATKKSG